MRFVAWFFVAANIAFAALGFVVLVVCIARGQYKDALLCGLPAIFGGAAWAHTIYRDAIAP